MPSAVTAVRLARLLAIITAGSVLFYYPVVVRQLAVSKYVLRPDVLINYDFSFYVLECFLSSSKLNLGSVEFLLATQEVCFHFCVLGMILGISTFKFLYSFLVLCNFFEECQ